MDDVERAIRLLRARPTAAALFTRPTVEQIVRFAIQRGIPIHGEQGGTPMTRTLNVYVPNPDAPVDLRAQVAHIDECSAIVGPVPDGTPDRVLVYYEGNRFGYANVKTLADKAIVAGHRCVEQAPTIARALVNPEALLRVGTLHLDLGRVEVEDGLSLTRLAKWLDQGTWDGEFFMPNLDPAELRASERF